MVLDSYLENIAFSLLIDQFPVFAKPNSSHFLRYYLQIFCFFAGYQIPMFVFSILGTFELTLLVPYSLILQFPVFIRTVLYIFYLTDQFPTFIQAFLRFLNVIDKISNIYLINIVYFKSFLGASQHSQSIHIQF
jgi:hypothetical protein